jgi:hypothetical protein
VVDDVLVVSRREPQELLLLDLASGATVPLSTRRDQDSLYDRTEPETLLARDGAALVLLASSDSEQGNRLVRLDLTTGLLSDFGGARGVSDVVGGGSVWLSSEFEGRLVELDERGGSVRDLAVPGAETNKILVADGQAWSVGLWSDRWLRRIDLATGETEAWVELGTHQWDFAYSPALGRLFVPRMTDGELVVLDATSLAVLDRWSLGFGLRPVEVSADGRTVYVGNQHRGEVLALDGATGERRGRWAIGGGIKALRVAGQRVFSGSLCGVYELGG